ITGLLEHDPEKHALGLRPEGWNRFSLATNAKRVCAEIMLKQNIERDDEKSRPALGSIFPTTCVSCRCHPGMRTTCTSLLWSRKKAEAARARSPSDLQSRRWRTASASRSSRRIHKAG